MWVTSSIAKILKPNAIALGNFDGIHRGHQQVVKPILQYSGRASNSNLSLKTDQETGSTYATVVTFNPHPKEFFSGESQKLLTTLGEKIAQLEQVGIEQLILLPFDRNLALLSPQQFVTEILVKELAASLISVGENFRFGYQRAGTVADLQAIASQYGISVNITSIQNCQEGRISSSAIRQALAAGDVDTANRLLGRAYSLTGKVVTGQKLGRTIGFPTANLQVSPHKLLPRRGVYAVRVKILPPSNHDRLLSSLEQSGAIKISYDQLATTRETWGVMNIGNRPTVMGKTDTVEVHLLDWTGDLYGQTITVELGQFLRPEQKFPSLDALKTQIANDCKITRAYLETTLN